MDYKAPELKSRAASAGEPLTELVGAIGHHVTSLVELQVQLATEDLKSAASRMAPPIAMCVAAVCLVLSACTVLFVALAELIVRYGRMERGFAYLLVAVLGFVASGVLVAVAIPRVRRSMAVLERSKTEFFTNLRSLSSVWNQEVRNPGAAHHNGKH
jgi:Putative Actinobacterial Holin-X, holin superfamily III